jgi:hypothetical protein
MLTDNTSLLITIQILDGVGVGIFGVVSVLEIVDLTGDFGRFNLTLGVTVSGTQTPVYTRQFEPLLRSYL